MRLSRWARATLVIGSILLGLGIGPLWLATSFFPGADPTVFALAFFLLAPLGAVITVFGLILWLVSLFRR
jgi:hypothetical protein